MTKYESCVCSLSHLTVLLTWDYCANADQYDNWSSIHLYGNNKVSRRQKCESSVHL